MRVWIGVAAVVVITSLRLAWASGCFGGEPDISPRKGSQSVPSNGQITIARRSPAGVRWVGPDQQEIAFRQRQAGFGPSAARILASSAPLKPGIHTIRTTGPDATHTFTVISGLDSLPPRSDGTLVLEAFNTPEPSSECPENMFIRASFPVPQDDRTDPNDFTYAVRIRGAGTKEPAAPDLVLLAETITGGKVYFRFGENGCGCIPRIKLESGKSYQVAVQAVDAAGHESLNTLSGTVTVPVASRPAQR